MTTKRKFPYRLVFFLLILQFTVLCKGQTAADKWFFGNGAGVDFSGPAPVGISGGQIKSSGYCQMTSQPAGPAGLASPPAS